MRILLTRFGGLGDLFYIEPTIRALSNKYKTKDIVIRTHMDYRDVFACHPCISNVVFDDLHYYLGYVYNNEPVEGTHWGGVNPNFDLHFDFSRCLHFDETTGEEGLTHAIDVFSSVANISLEDKKPKMFYNKAVVPKVKILAQLKSAGEDRDLSKDIKIRDVIKSFPNSEFIGETFISHNEFMSKIEACDIFVGTESSGVIAAHAMGKKTIGIYKNAERIKTRAFDGMLCYTQHNMIDRVEDLASGIRKFGLEIQETDTSL
jgi:hypothetical protein